MSCVNVVKEKEHKARVANIKPVNKSCATNDVTGIC